MTPSLQLRPHVCLSLSLSQLVLGLLLPRLPLALLICLAPPEDLALPCPVPLSVVDQVRTWQEIGTVNVA